MESVGFSKRRFRSFHGGKKFLVSHQMPNRFPPASFDSQDAQQTKTAFQLKQQIIARHQRLRHEGSLA